MDILSSVFYGAIQGATEFLPVSSSGHLALAQSFFGAENYEAKYFTFNILLHLGTLIAVLGIYYKDVLMLISAFLSMLCDLFKGRKIRLYNQHRKLTVMLIIATLPVVFVAPFIKDYVESFSSNTLLVGIFLLITSAILFIGDHIKGGHKTAKSGAAMTDALICGFFQLFAILPGISRSGSTISGGLIRGFDREFAVKFSFLMSIPAILGAVVFDLNNITAVQSGDIIPYIIGMITAAFSGFCAIRLIQWIARRASFKFFSVYCGLVGISAIIATFVIK